MYPISVYFGMFIQFQTTMTKIPLGLTMKPAPEYIDEGSDVNLFFSLPLMQNAFYWNWSFLCDLRTTFYSVI